MRNTKTHAPHPQHADRVLCGRRRVRGALVLRASERAVPTCEHCKEIIRDTHEDLL